MSELRKAVREYLAAQDALRNAHEARLAVGTDWGALHERLKAASHRLTEALTQPDEWVFDLWDGTTLAVSVTPDDPGDLGEPRSGTEDDVTFLAVRAVQ